MKAFRFRLNGLLHYRSAEREASARQLAEARHRLEECQQAHDADRERGRRAEEAWRRQSAGVTRLDDWLDREREAGVLSAAEARSAATVMEQEQQVAERRTEFLQNRRNERLLERLRSRAEERWQLAAMREEQKLLDDVAQAAREHRDHTEGGGDCA